MQNNLSNIQSDIKFELQNRIRTIFVELRRQMQQYEQTQDMSDVPFFKVMDNALIPNDCMVFNAEKLVFQLGEEPLPEIKICAQANAQHFHKLVVLMNYLDQTLAQNQQLNKRSVYYSLLSTFPQGQQDLDDRIFEVC